MSKPTSKITRDYIREKYDIDKERLIIPTTDKVGEIYFPEFDGKNIKDVREKICNLLNEYEDGDYIDIVFHGYDGDFDFIVLRETTRPETNDEVIGRLQNNEIQARRRQKQIEKAAKLLQENGYYGAIQPNTQD
jgi:hypothetical protein